jgi:outer membrane protein OmpA-like peptidoglycan-associated protein
MIMIYSILCSLAFAQDVVSIDIVRHGQVNNSTPALIVKVNQDAEKLTVNVRCGSTSASFGPKPKKKGEIKLELPTKQGTHNCTGSLGIEMSDGSAGEMPLSFQVTMHPELEMTVDKNKVDLDNKTLTVQLDRPAQEYSIQVIDTSNSEAGTGFLNVAESQNMSPQQVQWTDAADEVALIRITGKDIYGFYTQIELLPWHYDIPHEDVIFASNKSTIDQTEEPKLLAVQEQVQNIVDKYSQFAVVNLYVAGYTDTVGGASQNQTLSENRAKSIAKWFRKNGFQGNIYYQGFGETALAVPTADGVDEARNRRSLYVVAAQAPPTSSELPRSNWKKLQ